VRTLWRLAVRKQGPLITISALGDGFLYKMVRSLAGHLIRVGTGAVPAAETAALLDSKQRTARVETAPAHGLCSGKSTTGPFRDFPSRTGPDKVRDKFSDPGTNREVTDHG
jgi:tRNA U38,U39,U40 pseudouridine synthase TruA